jgi:hypothetical protein
LVNKKIQCWESLKNNLPESCRTDIRLELTDGVNPLWDQLGRCSSEKVKNLCLSADRNWVVGYGDMTMWCKLSYGLSKNGVRWKTCKWEHL